jgi:putative ABC transport system ATP-binding protein
VGLPAASLPPAEGLLAMSDTILSCQHVTKRFGSRRRPVEVLADVSLAVQAGQIAVIRGRSGTGKSTLLQILAGLDRPSTGSVEIAGRALANLGAGELAGLRRKTLGFVFQNFNLIPSWTAAQNVEAALLYTEPSAPRRRTRVQDMLKALQMEDRAGFVPSELSMGQQQRVAIARALVHGPALVFADEPTGDVDPETAKAIMDCLVGLVRDKGATLIMCTHGQSLPEAADQAYLLQDGKIRATRARAGPR